MTAPAGPYTVTHRQGPAEHEADCFWHRAHPPVDGDEAACCSCGAHADAAVPLSRWAYATLESVDGRIGVRHFLDEAILSGIHPEFFPRTSFTTSQCLEIQGQIRELNESGGMIRLPDGSEIVVEATTYDDLYERLGQPAITYRHPVERPAKILAAWTGR